MFTGLIQSLGKLKPLGNDRFQISCTSSDSHLILSDLAIGDSVAVDGVCLTVVSVLPQGFVAVASPETLSRTTLGKFPDAGVNLETSLRAGSKLGGHFVTGHVDAIGCLAASRQTANSWEMRFAAPATANSGWQHQIAPYLVPKGSIAVNGISLTVADCDAAGNWFEVAVIPHSFAETNLRYLQPGSLVNLEADILGKYVAKFLRHGSQQFAEAGEEMAAINVSGGITQEFLAEHGFM
ncbi:MAG: riboflavin synthase [Microcoleus sp.]